MRRHGSQATCNALAKDLSIDHPKTVSDYLELLVSMDAVYICPALNENKLEAAPKKAKKIMFSDPFIFHAVHAWLKPSLHPYEERLLPVVSDPKKAGSLVESTVITHYRRYFSSYYIKAEGEVDLAYVEKGRFYPVEIKWTGQLRPKNPTCAVGLDGNEQNSLVSVAPPWKAALPGYPTLVLSVGAQRCKRANAQVEKT